MHLRIAIIGNAASTMVRFRGPLIWALRALGHEIEMTARKVMVRFYFTGAYALAGLKFLDYAALALRNTQAEVTFIDISANCGQHSLFMSRRADRAIAFEPSVEAAGRLEANLALNGISNIALFRIALGDRDHRATWLGSARQQRIAFPDMDA